MIRIDSPYVESLLRRMIAIDSALPREGRLAEFLAAEIRATGVEPEVHEVAPGRPNVCASIQLGPAPGFLVFSGHSDTVPPASDWETDPFEPVVDDGRLFGLGAINMKSGLACMLGAFRALREAAVLGRLGDEAGRLGLAICVDQEGKSAGARALLDTEYGRCDAMLHAEHFFGDSPRDYLPAAVTGKVLYRVSVHGRAAHAFRPDEGGINAIADAARIVTALESLDRQDDPRLGRGTVCVLKVDGGYREYAIVVPERCELVITRLTVPGETVESAAADMRRLVDRLDLDSHIDVEMIPPCYEPYSLDEDSAFVRGFADVYRRVVGRAPHYAPHRGIVDANVFAGEGGIPTIVFGPRGGRHHRAGEYVDLASLAPVAEVYARAALRFFADATAVGGTPNSSK